MPISKQANIESQQLNFDSMVSYLRSTMANFPDKRIGTNTHYSIEDAALGAFSVFFTQSPSFLSFQQAMLKNKGISNAQTLFGMDKIPCNNHIRNLMDHVEPSKAYPIYHYIFNEIKDSGHLDAFRSYGTTCCVHWTAHISFLPIRFIAKIAAPKNIKTEPQPIPTLQLHLFSSLPAKTGLSLYPQSLLHLRTDTVNRTVKMLQPNAG